jgi:hypothetical protein
MQCTSCLESPAVISACLVDGLLAAGRICLSVCLQVAPSLAINYAAYETLRSSWLATTELSSPTVPMSLACGSLAGLVSSTATFPLDLVRRRLQLRGQGGVGGAGQQPATFRGMFRSVVQVRGRGNGSCCGGCLLSSCLSLYCCMLLPSAVHSQ